MTDPYAALSLIIDNMRTANYKGETIDGASTLNDAIITINSALHLASSKWRPITDCPKDGTPFLISGGKAHDEIWGEKEYDVALVTTKNGVAFDVCHTSAYSVWVENPSHWCPVPIKL